MTYLTHLPARSSPGYPIYEYENFLPVWKRARAVLAGQKAAREHDIALDLVNYSNLLVPFSPSMTPEQYRWYVAESELPGLAAQFARLLLGGLLRKPPTLKLPEGFDEEAQRWLTEHFTEDSRSLVAFLDDAVFEELVTTRCWISVDFPVVENYGSLTKEERDLLKPYPVIWRAEDLINWQTGVDPKTKQPRLNRVIFRYIDKSYGDNPFHPELVPTLAEHYLDESGHYAVQYYRFKGEGTLEVKNGQLEFGAVYGSDLIGDSKWEKQGQPVVPKMNGEPLTRLPVFPLNGETSLETPVLQSVIDKEVALYNLTSRRNHLLYGASTYTPVVYSDMGEEDFNLIISRGLGSWLLLGKEDRIEPISTPTDAITDINEAIVSSKEEMSSLGTRLLNPEAAESGIALQIRNAPQTAQLGTLNLKISTTMREIIALMLSWRYDKPVASSDIVFNLSADFDAGSNNPDTPRLLTEWYQSGLIPRSVWLTTMQRLELVPSDYNDEEGQEEISQDPVQQAYRGVDESENV